MVLSDLNDSSNHDTNINFGPTVNSSSTEILMELPVDSKKQRYPYCIVWTPIPLLTYVNKYLYVFVVLANTVV